MYKKFAQKRVMGEQNGAGKKPFRFPQKCIIPVGVGRKIKVTP